MRWGVLACCGWSFLQFTFAQEPDTSSLPSCGQYCVQNATDYAASSGTCRNGNSYCLCLRSNFDQSVKACANSTCTAASDQATVNAWTDGYCQDALAVTNSAGWRSATASSISSSATPTSSSSSTTSSTTSSSSPISPVLASTTATHTVDSAVVSNTASSTPSAGLSQTTVIGIGIGIPLAILCVASLGILLWQSKRKQKLEAARPQSAIHEIDGTEIPSELPAPYKGSLARMSRVREQRRSPSPSFPIQGPREWDESRRTYMSQAPPSIWNTGQGPVSPLEPGSRDRDDLQPHAL